MDMTKCFLKMYDKEIGKNTDVQQRKNYHLFKNLKIMGEDFKKTICIVGGGIKVHSTLRPLNGLLCQPRVIMIVEKSVE
jgi:hypothetical protein